MTATTTKNATHTPKALANITHSLAAESLFDGLYAQETGISSARSHEDGYGRALRLEDSLLDVAEILAVDLERERTVAADLDPVEVVADEELRGARMPAQQRVRRPQ